MSLELNSINDGYQNSINDGYQKVMNLRLGSENDPSIRDLAKANTSNWKGKIVQFIRNLTGNGISKKNNTLLVNRAYGEGMFLGIPDASQAYRQEQVEKIASEMKNISKETYAVKKGLTKALMEHHWQSPDESMKKLDDLEKKMGHLAAASKMLCGKCKSAESVSSNKFAEEMSSHSTQFAEMQKNIRQVRKELEENEKVISDLRAISPEHLVKAANSTLNREFIRFYLRGGNKDKMGDMTGDEVIKLGKLYDNANSREVKEIFDKFVVDYAKNSFESKTIALLKLKMMEPALQTQASKITVMAVSLNY